MKQCIENLIFDLESNGFEVRYSDDHINIARKSDGLNCEFYTAFYGFGDDDFTAYNATYTVNGRVRDLNFELPYQHHAFISTIKKILA